MNYTHKKESFFMIPRELTQSEQFHNLSASAKATLFVMIDLMWYDTGNKITGYHGALIKDDKTPMEREDIIPYVDKNRKSTWFDEQISELKKAGFLKKSKIYGRSYYVVVMPKVKSKSAQRKETANSEGLLFISAYELKKKLATKGMNEEFFYSNLWDADDDEWIEKQWVKLIELEKAYADGDLPNLLGTFRNWCKEQRDPEFRKKKKETAMKNTIEQPLF